MIVCVSTGSEEFQLSRGFDQGLIYLRVRPRVALGPAKQLAAHPRRSIPRALVAGLETLDYGCEDRYAGEGAAAFGHRSGAWRKSHPSHKWQVSGSSANQSQKSHSAMLWHFGFHRKVSVVDG